MSVKGSSLREQVCKQKLEREQESKGMWMWGFGGFRSEWGRKVLMVS
jgi:hypothetical protein